MTYFYMNKGTILRQDGGDPPSDDYVAIDPQGIMRHIKNGNIDQAKIIKPGDESKEALNMLKYRKKKIKKVKVKRCKCK